MVMKTSHINIIKKPFDPLENLVQRKMQLQSDEIARLVGYNSSQLV